ncbi:MAG: hypothetical protein ACF8XB_13540, partial [Planctomycetota bacterium JB042]
MRGTERCGTDGRGRRLHLLRVGTPERAVAALRRLDRRAFACLLVWDAAGIPVEAIVRVADALLDAGGVAFDVWGADCERVHDVLDESALERDPDPTLESVIMTSWHADPPLSEAIFSFLEVTPAGETYDVRRGLAVLIGEDPARARSVAAALADPAG